MSRYRFYVQRWSKAVPLRDREFPSDDAARVFAQLTAGHIGIPVHWFEFRPGEETEEHTEDPDDLAA